MEALYLLLVAPFIEFGFMQRALLGSLMLSVGAGPVGVFLMLRRMSLTGDAMAHAILPGAAAGFLLYGLEIVPMTIGGLVAGVVVALGAGAVARLTIQKEDASMAAFYLIALAVGVVMVSMRGSSIDLMHVLFGTVLALDNDALTLIGLVAAVTFVALLIFRRALIAECLDPLFLRSVSKLGSPVHFIFLGLVVLNLVAGFQALGTLLSVGLMILPAAAARFWAYRVETMCVVAIGIGLVSSLAGLLLSYHVGLPSGPAIILSAGVAYAVSVLAGTRGMLLTLRPHPTQHRLKDLMMKSLFSFAVACSVITFLSQPVFAQDHRLAVVATFSIIGDFAREVGGDRIALRVLVGPNGDSHVYEPKPADAIALARADVVLVNGLLFEGFLSRLVEASGTTAPIVELTDGARIIEDPLGGHYDFVDGEAVFHAEPHDPHAWQSVANAKVYVENIERAFCAADAAGCPTYAANADAYLDKLTILDQEMTQAISAIPEDRRVVVVAHNAFRYFAEAYGVTFLSPQGVSTESEASAADVAGLVREIRERRAAAVFAENIADARLVEQIASEAGLSLGGTLYSDALSEPDGPAPTYLDLIRHNVSTITAAIAAN